MFEWDEEKRIKNLAKHGVDFCAVWDADWEFAVRLLDERFEYGEERTIAIIPLYKTLYTCVYTMRGTVTRVISLRISHPKERKTYEHTMDY